MGDEGEEGDALWLPHAEKMYIFSFRKKFDITVFFRKAILDVTGQMLKDSCVKTGQAPSINTMTW